jgi:hypothetical protein
MSGRFKDDSRRTTKAAGILENCMNLRTLFVNVLLLSAPCLSSCSSQQVYGMGQAWRRNECYKIVDAQEHGRCMASTSMSYDEYKRRIEAGKDAK